MGDHVFLKVMPKRGVIRFGKRGKLSSRYIRPFEVLEMVGMGFTAKLVKCSCGIPCLHVSMLQEYTPDPTHVVDWGKLVVDADRTFEEGPVHIMDSRDHVLYSKTVRLVKVLWQHRGVEEVTWERKDTMCNYSFLFKEEGMLLVIDIKLLLHMHVILCAMCGNFGTKFY